MKCKKVLKGVRESESPEVRKLKRKTAHYKVTNSSFGLSRLSDFRTKTTIFANDKIHDGLWNCQF
jgi:hypothetical protein